jgi:hypothetical protein
MALCQQFLANSRQVRLYTSDDLYSDYDSKTATSELLSFVEVKQNTLLSWTNHLYILHSKEKKSNLHYYRQYIALNEIK